MSDPIKNAENATIVPIILHIRPAAILSTFSNPNQSSRLASRIKAYSFRFELSDFFIYPLPKTLRKTSGWTKIWREKETSQGRLKLLAIQFPPRWPRLEDSSRSWKSLKCRSESPPPYSRESRQR